MGSHIGGGFETQIKATFVTYAVFLSKIKRIGAIIALAVVVGPMGDA